MKENIKGTVMDIEELHARGYRGILYILRGCAGSGKSFRAKELVEDKNNIFSADKWFSATDDYEEYRKNWAPDKLHAAHSWCKGNLSAAMQKGVTPVAVDNTNVLRRDFMPYFDLANQYQYLAVVEESQSPWWLEIRELLKEKTEVKEIEQWAKKLAEGFDYNGIKIKNGHGVPEAAILRMLMRFQPFTPRQEADTTPFLNPDQSLTVTQGECNVGSSG
jgi:predicted kinase